MDKGKSSIALVQTLNDEATMHKKHKIIWMNQIPAVLRMIAPSEIPEADGCGISDCFGIKSSKNMPDGMPPCRHMQCRTILALPRPQDIHQTRQDVGSTLTLSEDLPSLVTLC